MKRVSAAALPLRTQLLLGFALMSVVTTALVGVVLTAFDSRRMTLALREKSMRYASVLQKQLEPAVAFGDRLTAREIFDSFAADRDVDGLALYAANGSLLVGHGHHPAKLGEDGALAKPSDGLVLAVAPVHPPEGQRGQVYVSLNTNTIKLERRQVIGTALAIATVALLLSLLIAWRIARRMTNHIANTASVANLEAVVSTRTSELEHSREQYRLIAESTNAIPFSLDLARGRFDYIGPQAMERLGFPEEAWHRDGFLEELVPRDTAGVARFGLEGGVGTFEVECPVVTPEGRHVELRWLVSAESHDGNKILRGLMLDITDQRSLERELAQAQKLESVGRLASGVAHEINTPIQFISDSVHFVRDVMKDIASVAEKYRALRDAVDNDGDVATAANEAAEAEDSADLDYALENAPLALERALEGLGRVASIVGAMKDFAHPDSKEKMLIDLNRAIMSTLTIARNEYKYVAEVSTDLADLPPILCHAGEINQAVLNLVVNAAHAIDDIVRGTDKRGAISIRTHLEGDDVEIAISDSGGGIPLSVRDKIFDPFFTTKAVGKGTGQGLAIARSVIVEKHGGNLRFETELGRGTTFFIRLPVRGTAIATVDVAA